MPVTRSIHVDGTPHDAYEAARALLQRQITEGAFKEREADPGRAWGIAWSGPLASSRYLFQFRPVLGGTDVDASLWLGGLLGPLHMLLRRRGNRRHVDSILADLKRRVEGGDDPATSQSPAEPPDPP